MKKERSNMDANIAKVTAFFSKAGDIGHTSDARRALESDYSDYVLKEMIRRGLLIKIAFDTYQLTTGQPLSEPKQPAASRPKAHKHRGG